MSEELETVDLGAVEKVNFDSPKGVSEGVDLSAVKSVDFGPPEDLLTEVLGALLGVLPPVSTVEQLVGLGRENLLYAREVLRKTLSEARSVRKKQWKMLRLIDGRPVEKLQKIAKRYYKNPQYEPRKSKWEGEEIMPGDPEASKCAAGSTTLNICGWCMYAVPYGAPRGRTLIRGEQRVFRPSCGFCHDEWKSEHEKVFNTPCILMQSQEKTDEICEKLRERHWKYMEYYHRLVRYIGFIDELAAKAESKPLFPEYRTLRHYAEGTLVYYFHNEGSVKRDLPPYPFGDRLVRPAYDIWRGKVVGYVERQHVPGAVEILIEGREEPTTFTYTDGNLVSFEELAYLAGDSDYARMWMESQGSSRVFLLDALTHYQKNGYFSMRVR